jgi:hypothetical protein
MPIDSMNSTSYTSNIFVGIYYKLLLLFYADLTLMLPNEIPFVIRVILVAGKVFTHNCDTGKLSALIQCWNIVQQIERGGFQRCQT